MLCRFSPTGHFLRGSLVSAANYIKVITNCTVRLLCYNRFFALSKGKLGLMSSILVFIFGLNLEQARTKFKHFQTLWNLNTKFTDVKKWNKSVSIFPVVNVVIVLPFQSIAYPPLLSTHCQQLLDPSDSPPVIIASVTRFLNCVVQNKSFVLNPTSFTSLTEESCGEASIPLWFFSWFFFFFGGGFPHRPRSVC